MRILNENTRNKIQKLNIILGVFFKGLTILLNLVLISILIKFFGKEEYGVWITVFSVVNWTLAFDLGIGTSLRNKLTESLSESNYVLSNQIISTSYILISFCAILIGILVFSTISFFNFQTVLNYNYRNEIYLKSFVYLTVFFTLLNFILNIYKKLYLSIHKSYMIEISNSVFTLFFLISVYLCVVLNLEKDLLIVVKIHGFVSIFIAICFSFLFFKNNKKLKISIKFFKKKLVRPLISLGGNFFIINICLLVILFTDNLIISKLLGPSYVSDYSVVQKIFQLFIVVFGVVLASSWGLYSEAIIQKDYNWIIKNIKKMKIYLLGLSILGCIIFFFLDQILVFWIGKNVIILPRGLGFANLIYFIIFSFTNIYMYFINATGQIKLQLKLFVFGAIVNIPLSIYFVNFLGTSTGVILSTIICTLPLFFGMPIQTKRILRKLQD
jgi:O-antigen/teichoic acid export membrane protein